MTTKQITLPYQRVPGIELRLSIPEDATYISARLCPTSDRSVFLAAMVADWSACWVNHFAGASVLHVGPTNSFELEPHMVDPVCEFIKGPL